MVGRVGAGRLRLSRKRLLPCASQGHEHPLAGGRVPVRPPLAFIPVTAAAAMMRCSPGSGTPATRRSPRRAPPRAPSTHSPPPCARGPTRPLTLGGSLHPAHRLAPMRTSSARGRRRSRPRSGARIDLALRQMREDAPGHRRLRDEPHDPRRAAAEFKDLFGVSRKWAVPLLEHSDRVGWTVRSGDERKRGGGCSVRHGSQDRPTFT